MQLSNIRIINSSGECAFVINGAIIIAADPEAKNDTSVVDEVALNMSGALGLTPVEINFDILSLGLDDTSDWNWDDVIASLVSQSKLPSVKQEMPNIIHRDVIQDWELSEGASLEEMNTKNTAKYDLTIERNSKSGQLWLSIVNSEIAKLGDKVAQLGLHALIEIRDGVPAMSIGMNPDKNIIQVMTDTSSELAVIKNVAEDRPAWLTVGCSDAGHEGLCFHDEEGAEEISEVRAEILQNVLADFDFCAIVKDTGNWGQLEDDVYEMVVFLDNGDLSSTKVLLLVTFQPNGAHVISALV